MKNEAREEAVKVVYKALMECRDLTYWGQADTIVCHLVEQGFVEFAPCACGLFTPYTLHHQNGCVLDAH